MIFNVVSDIARFLGFLGYQKKKKIKKLKFLYFKKNFWDIIYIDISYRIPS